MYHDQGLPVLKAASFGHGVNVTLGLPFVRTSVDHGTALDLAADAGARAPRIRAACRGDRSRDRARSARDRGALSACTATPRASGSARTSSSIRTTSRGSSTAIAPHARRQPGRDRPGAGGADRRADRARRAGSHAIEIDRDLAARLAAAFPPEQLTLHVADALEFDFATLGPALRVVGNLPYNISSPLLFHLAALRRAARRPARDAAEGGRRADDRGAGDARLRTADRDAAGEVSREPAVHRAAGRVPAGAEGRFGGRAARSARRRASPAIADAALFARIVAAAFGQRRKTLRNALPDSATRRRCAPPASIPARAARRSRSRISCGSRTRSRRSPSGRSSYNRGRSRRPPRRRSA